MAVGGLFVATAPTSPRVTELNVAALLGLRCTVTTNTSRIHWLRMLYMKKINNFIIAWNTVNIYSISCTQNLQLTFTASNVPLLCNFPEGEMPRQSQVSRFQSGTRCQWRVASPTTPHSFAASKYWNGRTAVRSVLCVKKKERESPILVRMMMMSLHILHLHWLCSVITRQTVQQRELICVQY